MLTQNELQQKIAVVLGHYPYILRAELFGSYQRGDATSNSDIDLLVHIDQAQRPIGVLRYAVELELEKVLGMSVDVVHEDLLRERVRQGIAKERTVVYEKAV